jgi:TRAP-type transport system periplasmic protein
LRKLAIKPFLLLLAVSLMFMFSAQMYPVTIKVGSVAPDRSPWGKALKEMAIEWSKITNGQVRIKIYPGGIAGSENDVIRKMRIGLLGGGVFTNRGFIHIYPDIYSLNVPLNITEEDELNYVLDKMRDQFEQGVELKGYKVVLFTMAGWLHFFTKRPLKYPEDLKKQKIAYTTGEPKMEQAWKKSGFHIVPIEMKDMMMGLQSGMTEGFYFPPILAGSTQFFALAPYMSSQRFAPLVGGIILTQKAWRKIPEKFRKPLLDSAKKMSDDLYKKIVDLELEAIETMKKNGLKIVDFAAGSMPKWRETVNKGMDKVIGKAFSKEILDQMNKHLNDFRSNKK